MSNREAILRAVARAVISTFGRSDVKTDINALGYSVKLPNDIAVVIADVGSYLSSFVKSIATPDCDPIQLPQQ